MNITEVRQLIRQSEDKSWYNSISIEINYPHTNFEIELSGLDTIYQFFEGQNKYFSTLAPLPKIFGHSKRHFEQSIIKIETYATRSLRTKVANIRGEWRELKSFLERNSENNNYFFDKESATTDFILKLDSEFRGAADGAYDFLTDKHFQYNNTDKNYFIGWHRAYEFFTQDESLVKRRNNEKQTLSRIRSQYIKNLEQNDKNVSDHIAEKEQEYYEKEKAISRLIQKKNHQYENWKSDSQDKFDTFLKGSDKAFKELEVLYKEKLKLEAPAKYWQDRSTKLRKEGNVWLRWLVLVITVAVISLGIVLYFISDSTMKDLFSQTSSAIRWSIVFVTFISFMAYGIRTFAKLMFSAYHLHRDAEEREQLAYVYLALKKEQNIDDTERHLIMQSLFSRADSGLLKDESSPTMPGGSVVEKILGGK